MSPAEFEDLMKIPDFTEDKVRQKVRDLKAAATAAAANSSGPAPAPTGRPAKGTARAMGTT
jgi:hypothetical protein